MSPDFKSVHKPFKDHWTTSHITYQIQAFNKGSNFVFETGRLE